MWLKQLKLKPLKHGLEQQLVELLVFLTPIPFAEGATTMTVAVWSPTAGTPIRLKVEASNDETDNL